MGSEVTEYAPQSADAGRERVAVVLDYGVKLVDQGVGFVFDRSRCCMNLIWDRCGHRGSHQVEIACLSLGRWSGSRGARRRRTRAEPSGSRFKCSVDTLPMPGMLRKSTAFVPRYQKFESISLQRRVRCELDFRYIKGHWLGGPEMRRRFCCCARFSGPHGRVISSGPGDRI